MPVIIVLAIGVIAISSASILIRLLPNVPALSIAAWRLVFSAALTIPLAAKKGQLEELDRNSAFLGFLGGFFLAVHFSLWITSIKLTTVASAVVLGTTTPIWVSIVSHFFLNEKNNFQEWLGILISVLGGFLVGYGDIGLSKSALLGDLLALLSAWAISAYFIIGRKLRTRLSLLAYTATVYTSAAIFLLVFCLVAGAPLTGFKPKEYFLLFLLALLPQLVGHNALNWALARLKASLVTLSVLAEAVISGTLAAIIFHEIPPLPAFLGYFLIIGGIVFTTGSSR
jgi:drug/metabolite transporter (DMT)-like permease